MDKAGEHRDDMWDEEDGFYYDVLRLPDGEAFRLKVRSMVGLLPLCASTVFEEDLVDAPPEADGADRALQEAPPRGGRPRGADRRRASSATPDAGCSRPSPGRSSSASSPTCSTRTSSSARTASARSRATTSSTRSSSTPAARSIASSTCPPSPTTGCSAGNSNWRGPVWMPVNVLIVRGLLNLYGFYGDDFKVECPTGSGNRMTLFEVAQGDLPAPLEHLPARRERPPAGLRRHGEVPGRPALARPDPLLRVLPRRQRGRPRGQPPDGLDGPRRTPARPLRTRDGRGRAGDPQGEARGARGPGAGGRRQTLKFCGRGRQKAILRSRSSSSSSEIMVRSRVARARASARPVEARLPW